MQQEAQITIHIPETHYLKFSNLEVFEAYVDRIRKEAKNYRKFEHLPLLKIVHENGEELLFDDLSTFPAKGFSKRIEVVGKKGEVMIEKLPVPIQAKKGRAFNSITPDQDGEEKL
jgi:uncharacterized protein YrzB (UPF0473 family)